jgi:hypothetical protein
MKILKFFLVIILVAVGNVGTAFYFTTPGFNCYFFLHCLVYLPALDWYLQKFDIL